MRNTSKAAFLGILMISISSCQTSDDAYGNPRKSVDPTPAVAGVAAVGLRGYALANDDDDKKKHRGHDQLLRPQKSFRSPGQV